MELLLIKAEYSNPNNVLPDGFPGKGDLLNFPFSAFNSWDNLRYNIKGSVNEKPDLKNCLINNNIKEDLNIWANIFDKLRESIIPLGKDSWTEAKYDLYAKYLIDPRSCLSEDSKTLNRKYYPYLDGYEIFSLWKNLVKYVEDQFGDNPSESKKEVHKCLRKFKEKFASNGGKLTPRQYAEFLVYFVPSTYFRIFVMNEYGQFPQLKDLYEMYEDGLKFDRNFLIGSWYVRYDNHERIKYGEEKSRKVLDLLVGNTKYNIINV